MADRTAESRKILFQIIAVIAILVLAVAIFMFLKSRKKDPPKTERPVSSPLITAQVVHSENSRMIVTGYGVVQPKVMVQLVPQVSGKVIACHENFVNGGYFKANQVLVEIDPRDYKLAVESSQAAVAGAQVTLDKELAEAKIALTEWQQIHPDTKPSSSLVLREPQINQAKAQLQAAKAQLETAKLNLERTKLSLPFDGRISQESIDIGQYLTPGQSIAAAYGTDVVEIVVPLEDSELAWFDVPMLDADFGDPKSISGSKAVVNADFADGNHSWDAQVVRMQGRVDPSSRMVNIVVEVPNPFEPHDSRPPLLPDMFVEVLIQGKNITDIISVPRYAVHEGNQIWLYKDGRLQIKTARIIRRDKEFAYITDGLNDSDVIITSQIDTVTDGMLVRMNLTDLPGSTEDSQK